MKKQLRLLTILLISILGILNLAGMVHLHVVKATYVEGAITSDTIWKLVSSPFIVSNNVTIYSNASLTIEPGVEVRFGEDFSIVVNGRVIAPGTNDEPILFTSNRLAPGMGDWGTLLFDGTGSSLLVDCIIEYGTDGIMLEHGTVSLQDSVVRYHSENGITVKDGNLAIMNNQLTNNNMSGIYIAGGNNCSVQYNSIGSNADGISLAEHLLGEIDIEHNAITLNGQSGVVLEADAYDNTVIINNTITSNVNGFRVYTNTSTYITRNYIINNTIGINYQSGTNHEAHFNDIYSSSANDIGISVSDTASVNAEYNYWGHASGPRHDSLNPFGMGTRVGGNGANLDFIFFLTAPIDYSNSRPTAVFWADKTLVAPYQTVTFIGTDSYDDGRVDQYVFDFNDTNTVRTTLSLFDYDYSSVGTFDASLKVVDDFNATSENIATTTISVANLTPLNVLVTLSNETVDFNADVLVTAYVSDGTNPLADANVTLFSVKGGSFSSTSGLTNSTGYFTTTFTAPNVTEITDVRMIVRASKTGFADGSDHRYLRVVPPLLVQVNAEEAMVKSEAKTIINVEVTLGPRRPIKDALVIMWSDYGSFLSTTSETDENGHAAFNFTAPQTLSQIDATVKATVIRIEYAEGQGQTTITIVPKVLVVDGTAKPLIVISEETSTITALVTYDGQSITDAIVTASADIGEILPNIAQTNASGTAVFAFTAPQVVVREGAVATITFAASREGYLNGAAQVALEIMPRLLSIQVTPQHKVTVSEAKVNVTAHVAYSYDMTPVWMANVTVTSPNGGNFSAASGLTDPNGNVVFEFTAPQANAPLDVIISASASRVGYIDGQNQSSITVNPGLLNVSVNATSQPLASGEVGVIKVYVMCNETGMFVPNALITMSSMYGSFATTTGYTDLSGQCTFLFNAPNTTSLLSELITANATKNGFVSAQNQTSIDITPQAAVETGGGLPITTILLIIVPIVIVIIVVALIKLKIIAVSVEEES